MDFPTHLNGFLASGYGQEELFDLCKEIGFELWNKFANNTSVVPYAWYVEEDGKRRKQFSPLRHNCRNCPGRGQIDTSHRGDPDRPRILRNWNLCAYRTGRMAAEDARAKNPQLSTQEYNAIWQRAEKVALTAHNYEHSPDFMYWHVMGRYGYRQGANNWFVNLRHDTGEEAYFGFYSHDQNDQGRCTSADHDNHEAAVKAGGTPQERMLKIVRVCEEIGLGRYVFCNKSYGGSGRHNHILHEPIPSPLRYALITTIVERAGLTPGTQPDQGQTECFPKQPHGDGKYGNLIGSPICYSRIVQNDGATAPLDPRTGYTTTLEDPREVLAFLKNHPVATKEEIYAACKILGIDPENLPAPKKRYAAGKKKLKVQGKQYVYDNSKLDELDKAVLSQITVTSLIASECGRSHADSGTDHYFCPIHGEAENARSFHVYIHSNHGVEWWKCHGDCNRPHHCSTGDAIQFFAQLKRISRGEARAELARRVGIDPTQYKSTFVPDPDEQPESEGEQDDDHERDDDPDSDDSDHGPNSDSPRGGSFGRAVENYLDEKSAWLVGRVEPQQVLHEREVIRSGLRGIQAAVIQGKNLVEQGVIKPSTFVWGVTNVFLKHNMQPELIVEALSPLLPLSTWKTKEDLLAEVGGVLDRLNSGRSVTRASALREKLPISFVPLLMAGVYHFSAPHDAPAGFLETCKDEIGFARHADKTYDFLTKLAHEIKAQLKPTPGDQQDPEQVKLGRHYRQLKTVTKCGRFSNEVIDRYDDKKIASRAVSCHAKGCQCCWMCFTYREERLALEEYRKRYQTVGTPPLHSHTITGIPFSLTYKLKAEIARHCKYPKLCVVSFYGGMGVLMYVTHDDHLLSRIRQICNRVYGKWKRETNHPDASPLRHTHKKHAAPYTVVYMISYFKLHYHLELMNRIERQDKAAVLEFLWATYNRPSLTRSKGAPYWPTKLEVKAAIRSENEDQLPMSQQLGYRLIHNATETVLGERDARPYVLHEAIEIVRANYYQRVKFDKIDRSCTGTQASIKRHRKKIDAIMAEPDIPPGAEDVELVVRTATGVAVLEPETSPLVQAFGAPRWRFAAPGYVPEVSTHASRTAEEYDEHDCEDEPDPFDDEAEDTEQQFLDSYEERDFECFEPPG